MGHFIMAILKNSIYFDQNFSHFTWSIQKPVLERGKWIDKTRYLFKKEVTFALFEE